MTTLTRRCAAFLAFLVAVAVAVAASAPAAQAATGPRPVAVIHVPPAGFYDLRAGERAVFLLLADETHRAVLRRIDPATNTVTYTRRLDSYAGGLAVGAGAVWASMYYDNTVERLDPATGRRLATIKVGLQPQFLHVAFGSIWVSNVHGRSVSRIDPATNRVIATVPAGDQATFRSGPKDITSDSHYVYVGASNGNLPLTVIDPRTNRDVRVVGTNDGFGGELVAAGGALWSMDHCTNSVYRLDKVTGHDTWSKSYDGAAANSLTVLNSTVWIAYDATFDPSTGQGSGGRLEARNPRTGQLLRTLDIGGDAGVVRAAFGDLWVIDPTHGTVSRYSLG